MYVVVLVLVAGCGDDIATPTTATLALALDEELRVLDLDGGSERWTSARTYAVDWSPDGRWLAALTLDEGGVLIVDDADSRERVLTARCDWTTPFAWAPDGARLAFRSRDPADYRRGGISIFDTGTGQVRALTAVDGDDERPVWAPDGRRLLFHRKLAAPPERGDVSKLMVADLDTGALSRWTDTDETISEESAVHSGDGRWLAFTAGPWTTGGEVWAYGPAGRRVLGPPPHAQLGPLRPRPGASELLYGVAGEHFNSARMIVFNPDLGTEVELDRTDFYLGWWDDAVWSPDGRLIAFGHDRGDCSDFATDIYLYDVDRREKRRAATLPVSGQVRAIVWAPDGERFAVLASDCYVHTDQSHPDWGTTRSQIHVITVATGAIELLHVEPRISSWDLAWRT